MMNVEAIMGALRVMHKNEMANIQTCQEMQRDIAAMKRELSDLTIPARASDAQLELVNREGFGE